MRWYERFHDRHHHSRRLRVLGDHLIALIPEGARLLDVGCGDGLLTQFIAERRPDLEVSGVDVLVRPGTHVPVTAFDGLTIPFADDTCDAVMMVDVLHHTDDPRVLLAEARRVSRGCVLLKDHVLTGWLAEPTLEFMDRVSNLRHGIDLPFNYWTSELWQGAFEQLSLEVDEWRTELHLYPWWARWAFERSLHFVARLTVH